MKTNHSPFIFVALLFALGCTFSCSKGGKQPVEKQTAVIDTMITLRTDSINPEWNAQLDSMLRMAATAPQDTNLAKVYYDIGRIYENYNNQEAKEYYHKLNALSGQLGWNKGHYLFASGIGNVLDREGLMDSAIFYSQQVLKLAKKENDEQRIALILANIGVSYHYKQWYETALNYYNEALSIFEKRGEKFRNAHLYSLIADLYGELNMQDENLMYCEKALNILNEKPDTLLRADALNNYAIALAQRNKFEMVENSLFEALRISTLHNNKFSLRNTYSNLGEYYLLKFDLNKAEKYTRKALEINEMFGDKGGVCITNRILSKVELNRKNFDKSEKYANKALEIALENDIPVQEIKCYQHLSNLAILKQDFRTQQFYDTKADSIEIAMDIEKTRIYAKEMAAKYDTEKKNLEIENQKHIIKSQNLQRGLLAGGVAVSIVILALLWYMLRLRDRRNRALAEMNATKDKFFSIISHDLKNPAVAQRDALQLLIKNTGLWDAPILAKYYEGLLETAEGQVELVYNLLNWAQIQTGRMTYTPATFNLSARLRSDISIIRKMAENKGVTFIAEIPEDAIVTGDNNMFAIVMRNLLTNAVKFTPAGGTVTLVASPCDKGACPLVVSVADTGTGMSEEQIRYLFQLDGRQSRRGTAGEQGSGLGLIVCKELLEKHGSELHVESEEGKGSRFWFTI